MPWAHSQIGVHTLTQQAVITGGNGSLGRAIAEAMQSPDWDIAAPGRQELDLSNNSRIRPYFHHRPVDLLVCAAGVLFSGVVTRVSLGAQASISIEAGLRQPLTDTVPLRSSVVWGAYRSVRTDR